MKKKRTKVSNKSANIIITSAVGMALFALIIVLFNLHTPESAAQAFRQTLTAEMAFSLAHPSETPTSIPTEPIPTVEAIPPTATPLIIPADQYFLENTSPEAYTEWIRILSGEKAVVIEGVERTIDTRYSYAMFTGQENAKAMEYLVETLSQWYPPEQIIIEPYVYQDSLSSYTWKNIVVTIPGQVAPDEQIIYGAHYDSCIALTKEDPLKFAPGANDNGTGVAALLEAAKSFKDMQFDRTLKFVFFSGEENFQKGSEAYVEQHANDHIIGMINMDMFGYDGDGDRCFEIHVGTLPGSDILGQAYKKSIADYNLDLTYDYFPYDAYAKADQAPFWRKNIPAITIMENFLTDTTPGGCGVRDRTPNWHLPSDKLQDVHIPYAFDIARAGSLTVLKLAGAHPVVKYAD